MADQREPDQSDRFPSQLTRYRVGAYVEFDVWAQDDSSACHIVTSLGIPDASVSPFLPDPLAMEGRINGKRVTAEAYRLRCLAVHENPEEDPMAREEQTVADRDPQPGEVWRSRDRREPGRTVKVVEVDGPGGFVKIRTMTRGDGTPPRRWTNSQVRLSRFHQDYEFGREEAGRG